MELVFLVSTSFEVPYTLSQEGGGRQEGGDGGLGRRAEGKGSEDIRGTPGFREGTCLSRLHLL